MIASIAIAFSFIKFVTETRVIFIKPYQGFNFFCSNTLQYY